MRLFRSKRNMFRDYDHARKRKRKVMAVLALVAGVAFFVLMVHDAQFTQDVADEEPVHELEAPAEDMAVVPAAVDTGVPLAEPPAVVEEAVSAVTVDEGVISRGDTAAALLDSFMSPAQIHKLNNDSKKVYSLSRMRVGRPYRIASRDGGLERFEYEINTDSMLVIEPEADGFSVKKEEISYDLETHIVHGKITSSLYGAVAAAGEKPALAVRLADIFAWDVDFIRDIRVGDSFSAIVEKRYREGEFAGYGKVVAAEFVNQGDSFKGFRFTDENGREQFYDERGRSLRKAFLKAPLNFSRISSGFNLRRLHPVLKIRRAHPAIDYAAPSGTPVKAVGDGLIIKRGWDRGGGNYIKIRHNSVYETAYLHLKGFAKGMKKGQRVSQGQVIGYVGSTGMSTGPHLDFRMKKNGSYVNPRGIKSPSCSPVPKAKMAEFMQVIQPLMGQLHNAGLMQARADMPGDVALQ